MCGLPRAAERGGDLGEGGAVLELRARGDGNGVDSRFDFCEIREIVCELRISYSDSPELDDLSKICLNFLSCFKVNLLSDVT